MKEQQIIKHSGDEQSQSPQEMISEIRDFVRELKRERDELRLQRDELIGSIKLSMDNMCKVFDVNKRTIYRWRQQDLVKYHITPKGHAYFIFEEVLIAVKKGQICARFCDTFDTVARLNVFLDAFINHLNLDDALNRGV